MDTKKIHITLVGGQPVPVYHGIIATNPDFVEFIYSEDSKRVLKQLRQEVRIPSDAHELSPTNPVKIVSLAESLAKKYANDEVTVNISSGLKSWSHLFGVTFEKYPNASVVYMDQNNVLWNYRTMQSSSNFEFDMHMSFRLNGNPLEKNYTHFSDYTQRDKDCLKRLENIRGFNFQDFNRLTVFLDNSQQNTLRQKAFGKFICGDSYIEWEKPTPTALGFVRIVLYKKGKCLEEKFESENVMRIVFNTGWYELKIATILSKWEKAKEICMNCRFPSTKNADKNEVDIIVNTGTKILFVECKTQITHVNDIDKFRSVVKNYGGTGSKGLFITDAPMSPLAQEKCQEHHIMTYSLKDAHPRGVDKELFELLNINLFSINTK